jgi:sulfate/thiosulfate transport system permease protein
MRAPAEAIPPPAGPRHARRRWRPSRLELFVLVYLALTGAVPLAAALLQLVRTSPSDTWHAVTAPAAVAAMSLSVKVALLCAALNAPLGLLVAWVLGRYRFPGRRLLDALVDLPLAIPGVVAGISFMSLFGPSGAVGRAVGAAFAPGGLLAFTGLGAPRLVGTRAGLVLAGLYVTLPFVVRTVQPVVMSLEREAEEAAGVLGASAVQRFVKIVLPELAPAIAAGFGLAFARSMNEYGVAVLVSGNVAYETLVAPVYVYQRVEAYDYAGATGVAATLLALSLAVLAAAHAVQRRSARRAA